MKSLLFALLVFGCLNAHSQVKEQHKVKNVIIEFFDGLTELSDQKIKGYSYK